MNMNAGTLLLVTHDVIDLLKSRNILLPDGSFDQTKLDTIEEDVDFAVAVEAILAQYGLATPAKVEKVIKLLPLLVGVIVN